MDYTILILYKANHRWLSLTRAERSSIFEGQVAPLIQKFKGKLTVKLYDAEAFHAQTSDFLIVTCAELKEYYFFMEHLRDTPLFAKPYIELNDVVIGIENGFQQFEKAELDSI